MKKSRLIFLFITLACMLPARSTQAQVNDSLVVLFLEGAVGERPYFEIPDITVDDMDFTGDGVAEIAFFEAGDVVAIYTVFDAVKKEVVFTTSLEDLIQPRSLCNNEVVEALGFFDLKSDYPKFPVLKVCDGAAFFDPLSGEMVQLLHPAQYNVIGFTDVVADDKPEVIVVEKIKKVFQVLVGAGIG